MRPQREATTPARQRCPVQACNQVNVERAIVEE
jgi:hypothetical protein